MKKIQLKFAAQQLTKEQMKQIGGGGPPVCNVGVVCNLTTGEAGSPGGLGNCYNDPEVGCVCTAGGLWGDGIVWNTDSVCTS